MADSNWLQQQAALSLKRLLPRLEQRFAAQLEAAEWQGFRQRLKQHFPRVFATLHELYGTQYDFFYHLEGILASATEMWIARPAELKALDGLRESDPAWYQSNRMIGAMCYVDLFAGDLAGLRERLPYLKQLGISYLHLMPLFRVPAGDNDGGYAVSSYREVDPRLGTMEQLAELAHELRNHGISLCLDFIFNHTADEHDWARKACAGDAEYQAFYRMFPDRSLPDAYERGMSPIFPDEHPGSFTYRNRLRKWVWTSFHNFQWDLNYENPVVFNRMVEEVLFLANQGVEIVRLDAVAFLWKQLGTSSQNLPKAHTLIQAFNALARIAAPAVVFKSEAIVHPDEVRKYIGEDECQLSYNPQLMALLWDALATREVTVMRRALQRGLAIPAGCAWVNYVRCHDDIGFAFSNVAHRPGEGPERERRRRDRARHPPHPAAARHHPDDRRHPHAVPRRRDRHAERLPLRGQPRQGRRYPLAAPLHLRLGAGRGGARSGHRAGPHLPRAHAADPDPPAEPGLHPGRHRDRRHRQPARPRLLLDASGIQRAGARQFQRCGAIH